MSERDGPGEHAAPLFQLALGVEAGDAASEDALARALEPRVRFLLGARLRDREAARELTNQVLMATIQALRARRVREKEKLGAYVAATARNLANGHLREKLAQPRIEPLEPAMALQDAVAEREAAERIRQAGEEIARLEPVDQRILRAALGEGRNSKEIATALALSHDVVRARKSRALRAIAERLRSVSQKPPPTTHE